MCSIRSAALTVPGSASKNRGSPGGLSGDREIASLYAATSRSYRGSTPDYTRGLLELVGEARRARMYQPRQSLLTSLRFRVEPKKSFYQQPGESDCQFSNSELSYIDQMSIIFVRA